MALRVSTTDLDAWRYWKASESQDLAALLRRLRHQEPPGPAMLAGRALHGLLEAATGPQEVSAAAVDGVRFVFDCDAAVELPALREVKAERTIGDVTLVGKVDALIPRKRVWDFKLTGRFDFEAYAEAFQWRAYLFLFDVPRFTYAVFVGEEEPSDAPDPSQPLNPFSVTGSPVVRIREFHSFDLWSYAGLEADVVSEVNSYAQFYRRHVEGA